MPDINDRLNIEKSRPTLLYEELVRRLETEIGHKVKVWSDAQDGPLREGMPTPAMCPFAKLVPAIAPGSPRDNISQQAVLAVNVILAVEGYVDTDLFDVWGLFTDVIYPASTASQASYRLTNGTLGAMGTDWTISQPVTLSAQEGGMTMGTGQIQIAYRIQG